MHTDHEALLGFKEPKNINRQLARYIIELADYDLILPKAQTRKGE